MAHLRVWTAGGRAAPLSQKIEALLYPQTAKKQGLFPQFVQKQRKKAPVQTHRGLVYTPVVQRGNLMAAWAAAYIARKLSCDCYSTWGNSLRSSSVTPSNEKYSFFFAS